MQVVTRALGCIATASVSAEDLDPAGHQETITSCPECSNPARLHADVMKDMVTPEEKPLGCRRPFSDIQIL